MHVKTALALAGALLLTAASTDVASAKSCGGALKNADYTGRIDWHRRAGDEDFGVTGKIRAPGQATSCDMSAVLVLTDHVIPPACKPGAQFVAHGDLEPIEMVFQFSAASSQVSCH